LTPAQHDSVIGKLVSITWRAEDSSAVIAKVVIDGQVHTVKGPADAGPGLQLQLSYRWFGKWVDHDKFGRQYEFSTFCALVPHDRRGVIAYLVAIAEGIGERRAEKLWDRYGPLAVETLRSNPEAVADSGIMPLDAAREAAQTLHDEAAFESVKIDLLTLFAGRGFHRNLIKWCLHRWKGRAAEIVRRNPFALLLGRAPSCGWKRIDKLYLDTGGLRTRMKRQALAAVFHLRGSTDGHTWHSAKAVGQAVEATIGKGADPLRALRLAIRARLLVIRREDADGPWIAESGKARNERTVASQVKELRQWTQPSKAFGGPSLLRSLLARFEITESSQLSSPIGSPTTVGTPWPNSEDTED
jgi:exodeoxyribonuclease V alpha subunit